MAVETVQNIPQQYVTDLGVDFGKQLAGLTAIPLDTSRFAPQVAAQDPLQTQAASLAASGVGAYQPFFKSSVHTIGANSLSTIYVSVPTRYNRCNVGGF